MLYSKKNCFSLIFLIFNSLINIYNCLDDSSILLIPFKGKSLQKEEEPEDFIEPNWSDDDYPYVPKIQVYNSSTFINQWFYNGMYTLNTIGTRQIESYINIENAKFSIEKCIKNRVYSKSSLNQNGYYKPLNSETYMKKDKTTGNDIFTFIGDLSYKSKIKIGETKGNGLDFYFNEEDNDYILCGNLGLNLNTNLEKTNFISQLKKKNYINRYIWTLKYQTEEDGIIVIGNEPHYYQSNSYFMSQFCKIKAIPNQSPDTAWSLKMDEVRTFDKDKKKIVFNQNKVDFLVDRGLIIGTDEYKNEIDKLIFNDLIEKNICFCETNKFYDEEKGTQDEYYIYYCNKNSFMGNKYTVEKTYYNTFPSLEFYTKEGNMTFTLYKEHLFHEIYSRAYFLVVFKKSNVENNIWKLGEPFLSHFQFTFDQEQKTVGFYNMFLERINNDEYLKNQKELDKKEKISLKLYIIITLLFHFFLY